MARKKYSVRDVNRPIKLHNPDKKLIATMTKLTVLSVVSAWSSLFLFILFTIRAVQESGEEDDGHNHGHHRHGYSIWKIVYVANVFFMLSALFNCMCLYLILSFAGKDYDVVCGFCHQCILRCCKGGIHNCLGKERKKWIQHSKTISSAEMTASSGNNGDKQFRE